MGPEENRVLVVAPVGQDAEAMAGMLRAEGVRAETCAGAGECREALASGAGAVLVTEEALELPGAEDLLEGFRRQPAWSELPLIILTSGGESRFERLLELAAEVAGGVTLLERPMSAGTLLQSVRVALRSRDRQYQVRDLLAEQERQRRELQESEAQFRAMFSVASVGKAQVDPSTGGWVRVNAALCRMTGYTEAELLARSPKDLTHPDDREADWACFCRMARGEAEGYENEKRYVRADGRIIWVHVSANLIRDHEGHPVRTTAVIQDITDRKKAEAAVRNDLEALTRMHELSLRHLEAGGLEVLQQIMDAAVSIVEADKGTLQLLEGESLRIVAHHGHEQPFLDFFAAAENRASVCGEASRRGERVVVPDVESSPLFAGTPSLAVLREAGVRAVQSTPLMSRNGGLLGILTTQWVRPYSPETDDLKRLDLLARQAADLIEHERAQEALREKEEQFRTLADSIPTLAWWANGDGHITWYNRRWYEYTGTTLEQMKGWGWQSVHDPDMLERVLESWRKAIATAEPFEMEFPLRGADGRFRWFLTRAMPVKDGAGAVLRWFGTNTDVSEIREAREVLKRGKEELERLVTERTAELRELVGELEHFSYSITHDMRAPLRAMMGFGEAAKELCAECGNEEQKMFLDRIQTAARRMDLLITDALNYSKAVRSELPLAPIDVGRLLRGMVHTYPELQVAEGGIRIEPELPLVMGNEAGLTQCFSNLLGNAVKFVKPGEAPEIRVWAEALHSQPSTLNSQPEEWVRIWVEDRGIGIGPKFLPRVFDMFARGSHEQAGTGIGLALVRKVVQRMGGRVGVESEEGCGSRFWVELRSGDVRGRLEG